MHILMTRNPVVVVVVVVVVVTSLRRYKNAMLIAILLGYVYSTTR